MYNFYLYIHRYLSIILLILFVCVCVYICTCIYLVSPKKRNGQFLGLCFIQTTIFLTSLFLFRITPRTTNLAENFLFYEQSLTHCHFSFFSLLFHWWVDPQIADQSIFLGFALVNRLYFSPYCLSMIMTPTLSNLVGNFWFYE